MPIERVGRATCDACGAQVEFRSGNDADALAGWYALEATPFRDPETMDDGRRVGSVVCPECIGKAAGAAGLTTAISATAEA